MRFISSGVGALTLVLGVATQARADQFIVTDVTYTHSKDTTSDSHYRVDPSAATPKDWTKPVDWTKGSAHVLLEVKTKPTNTPTKFQICFEGNPNYACTAQSEAYTAPGTYQWSSRISTFYSDPAKGPMNWANGVKAVALILKDTNNGKPQGDPKYVPTDLHVEVAIVSEGATYQPPGAGSADAGTGKADAGRSADASIRASDASLSPPADAEAEPPVEEDEDAAVAQSTRDASTPRLDSGSTRDDGERADASSAAKPTSSDSGCALGGSAWQGGWLALSLALAARRRRRAA